MPSTEARNLIAEARKFCSDHSFAESGFDFSGDHEPRYSDNTNVLSICVRGEIRDAELEAPDHGAAEDVVFDKSPAKGSRLGRRDRRRARDLVGTVGGGESTNRDQCQRADGDGAIGSLLGLFDAGGFARWQGRFSRGVGEGHNRYDG